MIEAKPRQIFKEEDMLTVIQFARKLPCSVRQVYRLVEQGQANGGVKAYRYGEKKGIKIHKTEVERYRQTRIVEELNLGDTDSLAYADRERA